MKILVRNGCYWKDVNDDTLKYEYLDDGRFIAITDQGHTFGHYTIVNRTDNDDMVIVDVAVDKELQRIKDFREWHSTQAGDEELYGEHYTILFNGRSVQLPYGADVFDGIDTLLKNTIDEW